MRKILYIIFIIFSCVIYSQKQVDIPWPTLADSPWPMISHDPQLTGRSPYLGPKTPTIKWTLDLPYGVFSGPIIGENKTLYVGTNSFLGFTGDSTNYFYAINPSNGEIKWTFLTGTPSANESGYLINDEGTIFFGSQSGWLYAIDSKGTLKWKYNTGSNIHQLVMNTDLQGNIYITNASNHLHSFSKDGELNWKVNYGGGIFPRSITISPGGNTIYVSAVDRKIYALNLDGSIKWSEGCIGISRQPLTIDNSGNIYFIPGCEPPGAIISLDSTGNLRWEYILTINETLHFDETSVAIDYEGNIYYFYSVRIEGTPYGRIESVNYFGNHRWTYQFEEPWEWIIMPLVVDKEGTVYCGSTYGYYYYAISNQGELLWKIPLNGYYVDNSTAIGSDGTLYIGTNKGSTHTQGQKTLIAIQDTGTVSVNEEPILIKDYALLQNYPNPFNPNTIINYQLPAGSNVTLKVYDLLGREVATLVNEIKPAGSYEIEFNASALTSGVYFYKITAGDYVSTKKMILLR